MSGATRLEICGLCALWRGAALTDPRAGDRLSDNRNYCPPNIIQLLMPPSDTATGNRELAILDDCQDAIGYRFNKPELLRSALTHTSSANTRAASNERLEFLGDSVLGLVTCEQLFERFPEYQEGDLTKVKS